MSDKLFILNKMFEYMSENNQNTSLNLSDSPEYVDVFNDEMSTRATIPSLCDNNTAVGGGVACVGTGATCICTGATCVSFSSPGITGGTTGYAIALGLGIRVYTKYLNGTSVQSTSASTTTLWGRKIYAQYLGPNMYNALYSGQTYQFLQDVTDSPNKNYYYLITTTSCGGSSCATTIQNGLKTARYDFRITSFPGHDVPCDFYLSGTGVDVKVTSGQSLSIVTYPTLPKSIYVSALTYTTICTSGTTSAAFTDAVRNGKIGTKYTVTTVTGNKTATTVSGGSYVYSTSYVPNPNMLTLAPYNPFFIQTSAQSITINYERMGSVSSGKTYDLSSNPSYVTLPIQESNYRLATIDDLSNASGLGISVFNSMFNNATSNFKNIVITPNYYNSLTTANYDTSYKYYKPAIFFKAGSSNNNYCLRMNDISTFDKWMYIVGGISNSGTTYTNNNFDYKNYDSTNVKYNREWASNYSDMNAYFTLILK